MELGGTLLVAALSVFSSGALGYFFGLRQGKKLLRQERAAEVVIGWRRGIHEVMSELAVLQSYKNSVDRTKFSENVTQKVYELRMYGLDNETWLDERVRRKAWHLTDKLKDVTIPLLHDKGIHDTASNHAFDVVVKRTDYEEESIKVLLDALNREVDRSVGTTQPWWRRIFGG